MAECAGQPGGVEGLKLSMLDLEGVDFRIKSRIPKPELVGPSRHALPTGVAADRLRAFRWAKVCGKCFVGL